MHATIANETKVQHFVDYMEATTPGKTRARLERARAAIRRGDLQNAPHTRPAVVSMMRQIASDLQSLAVLTLNAATALNDAATVDSTCKAGIDADETLGIVLAEVKGGQ